MQTFNLLDLSNKAVEEHQRYLEFLRVPSLSVGVYHLPAGEADPQSPHAQDEVYYVLTGKAKFQVGDETTPALPGAILFVEAGVDHKFFDIEEFLEVLVFFAPAESN